MAFNGKKLIDLQQGVDDALTLLKPLIKLSPEDWDMLKEVVEVLEPFEQVTTDLSAQYYPSISKIIPAVCLLNEELESIFVAVVPVVQLKIDLLHNLSTRFHKLEDSTPLLISTYLDPRYEMFSITLNNSCIFTMYYRFKSMFFKKNVKVAEQRVVHEVFGTTAMSPFSPQPSSSPPTEVPTKSIWERQKETMQKHNSSILNTGSNTANGIVLIRDYTKLPVVEMDTDPLQYWKEKREAGVLVQLVPVIKKFLCVPATSVPSEQLFSKAGELISARRNRLSGKNVDMLLFLNKNM